MIALAASIYLFGFGLSFLALGAIMYIRLLWVCLAPQARVLPESTATGR
jgi:hypothetical protein